MTRSELVQKLSHWTLKINHAQAQEMVSIILDENYPRCRFWSAG